ncbi:MAG: bifunctional indole-3-glycerol-phosphate synthase TrpC/phosphoribosylanthranilate isomerase TrpF, partial [Planctomycetes bacterium]|nr:bifunctional indole-3-glycerol-phosphate synthase TrpC/phosphoribosylanthranilate isomerase TrpF [Planctomycetota bacterium]
MLEKILARTRADLTERKGKRSLTELEAAASPSQRSLEDALRKPRTGFVLECKKASPSKGLLRAEFDPAELAEAYAWGADAISVLTDVPFFQGSHAYLGAVSRAVPLPVLCKDFLVEPYQVVEARTQGADAVLLMLSVLDDDAYRACHAAADAWSLDCLTEVHDELELERATRLGAKIVGINSRDLKTLQVDLGTIERLAPLVPSDRVRVAESGVSGQADVWRLRPHVDAFLVGGSLVVREDVAHATRELIAGRFKVCGLTRPEDARAAWEAGATWGGLIFATESPRCLDPKLAGEVREAAPLSWVGVFVNDDPGLIAETAAALQLSAVQLHGEESQDDVAALRERLPAGCEVWKAVRVREALPARASTGADRLLLDAYSKDKRGGTGQRFDWALLANHPEPERLILSGGLSP